jgi:transcription elongation factor GreA
MNHRMMKPGSALEAELRRQLACLGDNRMLWFSQPPSAARPDQRELMETLQRYEKQLEDILAGIVRDLEDLPVLIGSEVTLRYEDGGPDETYRIVLPEEADVDRSRISCLSPMGSSLLLARVGDTVEIRTPQGGYRARIVRSVCTFAADADDR